MAYLMRNNCPCPICSGAVKMINITFICCDCKAEFEIKDEGMTDGEYVCEKSKEGKGEVAV